MPAMDAKEAAHVLEDAEVVPVLQATIPQGKEVLAASLEAGIPAVLGGGPGCSTGGCAPRVVLYAREEDLPELRTLLEKRWHALLQQEGTLRSASPGGSEAEPDGEPPCPACGTAAPLVDGACSDCGLQLE